MTLKTNAELTNETASPKKLIADSKSKTFTREEAQRDNLVDTYFNLIKNQKITILILQIQKRRRNSLMNTTMGELIKKIWPLSTDERKVRIIFSW